MCGGNATPGFLKLNGILPNAGAASGQPTAGFPVHDHPADMVQYLRRQPPDGSLPAGAAPGHYTPCSSCSKGGRSSSSRSEGGLRDHGCSPRRAAATAAAAAAAAAAAGGIAGLCRGCRCGSSRRSGGGSSNRSRAGKPASCTCARCGRSCCTGSRPSCSLAAAASCCPWCPRSAAKPCCACCTCGQRAERGHCCGRLVPAGQRAKQPQQDAQQRQQPQPGHHNASSSWQV